MHPETASPPQAMEGVDLVEATRGFSAPTLLSFGSEDDRSIPSGIRQSAETVEILRFQGGGAGADIRDVNEARWVRRLLGFLADCCGFVSSEG